MKSLKIISLTFFLSFILANSISAQVGYSYGFDQVVSERGSELVRIFLPKDSCTIERTSSQRIVIKQRVKSSICHDKLSNILTKDYYKLTTSFNPKTKELTIEDKKKPLPPIKINGVTMKESYHYTI